MTVTASDDELRAALAVANIPTLLLVLRQLTGDPAWFEPPYRPSRTIAMNDNDTGGLAPERQDEVRAAVLVLLGELRAGTREEPPGPGGAELVDMLGRSLGEPVPAEYAEAMAEEGGFRPQPAFAGPDGETEPLGGDLRVLVIGAGISGICVGTALRRLGADFTIVDRGAGVGGTWLDNDYPGAGVDTPSHLYSFSFAPKPDWTRYYAKQPEILSYLRDVVRDEGLLPFIRFGTEVVGAAWDEPSATWRVRTRTDGKVTDHEVDVLISSVGQLNRPWTPDLPGTFTGPAFHTAEWDHTVALPGRRVGVVGTGASAMQAVPAIAGEAGQTVVFQRSPQWVAPNANYLREVDPRLRPLMEQLPFYRAFYRLRLMWMFQDKLHPTLQKDPDWAHPERSVNAVNEKHRLFFTDHLRTQLAGRDDLVAKTLPDYPPYGKRMLMDCDWFTTLRRPDVELVTAGVVALDGDAVVTDDGARHAVDVLVWATGFAARDLLAPIDVRGRSGVALHEQWGPDDAWAYLGITVPDFPNLFLLYGPNTNLGHGGSTMFHAECQTNYVVRLLREMVQNEIASLEVRAEVCADYVARVDTAHEAMIWTHPGMRNWYRNAAGRVVTNTPWRLIDYWAMTRRPNLEDYLEVRRDDAVRAAS